VRGHARRPVRAGQEIGEVRQGKEAEEVLRGPKGPQHALEGGRRRTGRAVGDRERVRAAGFDGYLCKPIEPASFVAEVEAFLPAPAADAAGADAPSGLPTLLVVDDDAWRLDWAAELGMETVLVGERDSGAAHRRVRAIAELPDALALLSSSP
jgi:hypothetical protein